MSATKPKDLTAAAEVGDRYEEGFNDGWEEAKSNSEAAIIERCAQVADRYGKLATDNNITAIEIADAIRALKDK